MSDLSEIVGQDVNLHAEQPPPEAEAVETGTQEQSQASQEATQAEQPEQQPDSRTVPLAALHEERTKRKELAQRIEQIQAEQARRDALLEQRIAALTQQRQQAEIPAFEENPAEHLRHGQQQLQQTVQQIADANRQAQAQQQQMQLVRQLAATVSQHEAAFAQQTPDYVDAVNYLRNQRAAELAADGLDEARAAQMAHNEMVQLALSRAHQGHNPAEAAYRIARARGFTGKPAAPAPTPADKFASQQKGVAAAKTLGSGGPASNKITAEALASMSDDEFAELTKGNNWQKLMGG